MARYELVERIGVGGMAEIFRGKAIAGGGFEKPVAIKRILPHLSQDKRFVTLLITEAKTLSELRHRNIVQIYDVGLGDDGQYFLVMEYVDGVDLGAMFEALEKRTRRLPLEVALHIAGEVCEALDHAHRARSAAGEPLGLVHRDVSPSNVLLSKSGEVKLTDFGIAKRTEEATGHGGVRGKFAYISPEQAHNVHVDGRSDVYSVGIVLYELVTGQRLFSAMPDFDALRAVREGRTPRPREVDPTISPELEGIILRALAPSADDRFPSAGNFGAQLRGYRYSLEAGGDPAVEIARLVEEHRNRAAGGLLAREPTFVRISTVDGFTGGFELREESTGGGDTGVLGRPDTGELTRAAGLPADALEDEETHAVRLRDVPGARTGGDLALEEVETRVAEAPRRAGSGEFDLSDAETSVVDYRKPPGLLDRPLPAGLGVARLAAGEPSPAPGNGAHPDAAGNGQRGAAGKGQRDAAGNGARRVAAGSEARLDAVVPEPEPPDREATPTVRQMFHAGALLDRQPVASASPLLEARRGPPRRRLLLAAGGIAAALAVVGIVLAGALGGGEEAAVAAPPDAAPPPDASAVMTMPPEPVAPEPPKKKRKRPARKSSKANRGGKSSKASSKSTRSGGKTGGRSDAKKSGGRSDGKKSSGGKPSGSR